MFWVKLKAGALQLTLFVAVIIALLLTAFIILVQTNKRFNIQTDFIIETSKNTNKGIQYALKHPIQLNDTIAIDLNSEDYKTLKTHRDFWGVFEKITAVATIKKNTLKKVALIGTDQPETDRIALYVQENNKPLVVVGNTKIEGVAYLPERGVKSGSIAGQSYYGNQLIYGQTKQSALLPQVYKETIQQIDNIENQVNTIKPDHFLNLKNGNTYINSFLEPKQIVFSNAEIRLTNVKLIGHIIIQSKTKISVDASSTLKDVILIAPEIEIKNNVKGNFQAIAAKQIYVGNNVELNYPSALILNEDETLETSTSTEHNIVINDFSTIKGIVLFKSQPKTNNYNPQIEITEHAKIIGEVYCTENIELKGTVYGSVFTNNFIAKQSGSIYQNHIYNGTISVNQLPKLYVGLPFNHSKKSVLKWLY